MEAAKREEGIAVQRLQGPTAGEVPAGERAHQRQTAEKINMIHSPTASDLVKLGIPGIVSRVQERTRTRQR
jgi:hypothetical protein